VTLPLPIDSYQVPSGLFGVSRCVNWIPTVAEAPALSPHYLQQQYGIKPTITLVGIFRGAISIDDTVYVVQGTSFVRITADNVTTPLGVISGIKRVSMATNGRFVVVVSDLESFSFDTQTNIVTKIIDSDFITASYVVFKDGFFVFSAADGGKFFNSALNNPTSFNALDFGSAELSPDQINSLHVNRNELFVLGADTIEAFQNVGGAGFPFKRIPGGDIQKGVDAIHSVVEFNNAFCFLGGGLNEQTAVWQVVTANSVVKISTNAIDHQIQLQSREDIANAFSMTYQIDGQFILVITIGRRVLCYNATASKLTGRNIWFELDWSVRQIIKRGGDLLAFDVKDEIGLIDKLALTYFNVKIKRELISQPFFGEGLPLFEGDFELVIETGIVDDATDPIIRYSYSDDGGKTFSDEIQRNIGFKGDYEKRVVWRRQGRFPLSRVVKIEISDNVECNIVGMSALKQAGYQ